jgi:hypothetical protein
MKTSISSNSIDDIFPIKLFYDSSKISNGIVFELFVRSLDSQIVLNQSLESYFLYSDDVSDSDLIFIPVLLSELVNNSIGKDSIRFHVELARQYKKKIFIVSDSDLIYNPGYADFVILTPGSYRSFKNQIAIPALLPEDPFLKWYGGVWSPIIDQSQFRIGFCGQATSHVLKYLKDHFQYLHLNLRKLAGDKRHLHIPYFFAANERAKILNCLEKSSVVKTNFLKRERYKGGAKNQEDHLKMEAEFFQNIYENLFTVCIRGFGNYSVRFFQTLAMGRIPIVIESDSVLPFESQIQYNKICIRIPYGDRFQIDHYIIDFLKKRTIEEIAAMQMECRSVWLKYFQKPGYFSAIHSELFTYIYKDL